MISEQGIKQLYDEFHTPLHVRAHCLQVARIGQLLGEKLIEKGLEVDLKLVWLAGLAHDFIRIIDFKDVPADLGTQEDQIVWGKLRSTYKGHHADVGAQILEEMGESTLAQIVQKHKYCAILNNPPQTWEEKIIYYADKRVTHNDIVDLQERLNEGYERNFANQPITEEEKERRQAIIALEKEIFDQIDLTPEDVRIALGED
ncbi:HD domain-containing protein [Candidatus Peregrinibacteria bacterium]|jgi:uncharacterized protein|nr:HD domain-containing protein [Candidatus Peregrinibacteria bacterium]MBT7484287.1 HD domain-containing protein [Candidatus Peregrinibacteria bacterium]MBT7703819.1 HD domain-containing protein [Candidatus Peregrinibacteria bacterium]